MGDTIPWEFVQEMAVRGCELAQKGFTDTYQIMYQNFDGSILVSVSLKVFDLALAGPESGSGVGSSSQTAAGDWREGSVPSVGTGADANNNMLYTNWGAN